MHVVRRRFAGWIVILTVAVLVGVVTVLTKMWLPVTLAAGAAAIVAIMSGVSVTRATSALKENDDRKNSVTRLLWLNDRDRLPRVRDLDNLVALGVHPAAPLPDAPRSRMPEFVARDIMPQLCDVIRGDRFVLLVGESTAGKSRAMYEAMVSLLAEYRVIEPVGREGLQIAIETATAISRCVLWLDDIERFLGSQGLTGAAVRKLLGTPRQRRFILATMRSEEYAKYSGRAGHGSADLGRETLRHGWDVLRLATRLNLSRLWSPAELARAEEHRGDPRINEALSHAERFGVAEYVASGPQLLADWQDAWAPGTHPRAAALVQAAVDARRAGIHRPLPLSVLAQIHEHYLQKRGGELLRPEPIETALAWATTPLHATSSLLLPASGETYLAFDYLIDAAEKTPMLSDALIALVNWAMPNEALGIVEIAWEWHCLSAVEAACHRAAADGKIEATYTLSQLIRERDGAIAALKFAQQAYERQLKTFGPDHPNTLGLRQLICTEYGCAGDRETALSLAGDLLADVTRLFGPDHEDVLYLRDSVAGWTQEGGDFTKARELYASLAADTARILGADHKWTFWRRFRAINSVEIVGDKTEAFRQLLALRDDVIARGQDSHVLPTIQRNVARLTMEAGNHAEALRMYEQLVANDITEHGQLSLSVLDSRQALAQAVGRMGDSARAVRILQEAMKDAFLLERPPSDFVLSVGRLLADWTGRAGNPKGAVRQLEQLLAITTRQRGCDDGETLELRRLLAHWTGKAGDPDAAIYQLGKILTDANNAFVSHKSVIADCQKELTYWHTSL